MTKSAPVRVAVVGAGVMGNNHLRVYGGLKDVDLVGFYEPNDAAAEGAAQRHDCRRFTSLEDLAGAVDAVSICSPSVTHRDVGVYFLERGVHCLVEKPLATSEEDCRGLIAAADKSGATLLVGHIERFNPAVQQVMALLESGITVHAVEARRLSSVSKRIVDVDVVADLMVHDLDIVAALVGDKVSAVTAVGVRTDGATGGDHVTALLRFGNGAMANVTASRITQYTVRELSVVTDYGVIAVDYMNQSVQVFQRDQVRAASGPLARFGEYALDSTIERILVRRTEPLQVELLHFMDCVRNGVQPQVSGEQALQALQMVWRVQQSLQQQAVEETTA